MNMDTMDKDINNMDIAIVSSSTVTHTHTPTPWSQLLQHVQYYHSRLVINLKSTITIAVVIAIIVTLTAHHRTLVNR